MEINRKRGARRLASGILAGALALGGLAISGASPAGAVPLEEDDDQRVAGTDRYATAALVAEEIDTNQALGINVETLVVASGENFPDALAAAPLANTTNNGAIVLVKADSIPTSVRDRMNRLDDTVTEVYVVGGTSAISEAVFTEIEAIFDDADVTRIAGDNRYATAAEIGSEVGIPTAGNHAGTVLLVSGTSFADAVTAGAWASANEVPVLLANASGIPAETEKFLQDALDDDDLTRVIIMGGASVVGAGVEDSLIELGLEPKALSRIAGADRYATNLQFNLEQFNSQLLTNKFIDDAQVNNLLGQNILLVSGANYPDALAAAPLAAQLGAHLVLVDPATGGSAALTLATAAKTSVTSDRGGAGNFVSAALTDLSVVGPYIRAAQNIWIVGGQSAVPSAIVGAAATAAASSVSCSVLVDPANDSLPAGNNVDGAGADEDAWGPSSALIIFSGNLQTGATGEADLLDNADDLNDILDVENTEVLDAAGVLAATGLAANLVDNTDLPGNNSNDGAILLDLTDDGFADALLVLLADQLAEGDKISFEGFEADPEDYDDGVSGVGLREFTGCEGTVGRDRTRPTVEMWAVQGGDSYFVRFSESMVADYSTSLDNEVAVLLSTVADRNDNDYDPSCQAVNSSSAEYFCRFNDGSDAEHVDTEYSLTHSDGTDGGTFKLNVLVDDAADRDIIGVDEDTVDLEFDVSLTDFKDALNDLFDCGFDVTGVAGDNYTITADGTLCAVTITGVDLDLLDTPVVEATVLNLETAGVHADGVLNDGVQDVGQGGADINQNLFYDAAGNKLNAARHNDEFETIEAADYAVDVTSLSVTCGAVGAGELEAATLVANYANGVADATDLVTNAARIVIPMTGADITLTTGSGIAGLSGNDWSFKVEQKRGLLVPTVTAEGTAVTITIDHYVHDSIDIIRAINNSSIGRGGLASGWVELFDAGGLAYLNGAAASLFNPADLGDEFTADNSGVLATQTCSFSASFDIPVLNTNLVAQTGTVNDDGEFRIVFDGDPQTIGATEWMFEGDAGGGFTITGVISNTTEAATAARIQLYLNGQSSANAS